MKRLPAIIFVVDTIKEHISIAEGRRLRIPIGAIVDTNCDPDLIEFPIPANDDALKSVQLITKAVADEIASVVRTISPEEIQTPPEPKVSETVSGSFEKIEAELEEVSEEVPEEVSSRRRRVVHKKIARVEDDL
jgi:small subunit ribosomal protein S2